MWSLVLSSTSSNVTFPTALQQLGQVLLTVILKGTICTQDLHFQSWGAVSTPVHKHCILLLPDVLSCFKKQINPCQNSIPLMQKQVKSTHEIAMFWVYMALYTAALSDSPDLSMSAENLSKRSELSAREPGPFDSEA